MPFKYPNALYKVCAPDGASYHDPSFKYPLPRDEKPGAWTTPVKPEICTRGYHVSRIDSILEWVSYGYAIFLAEGRGEFVHETDKSAYESIRLVRRLNWDERLCRLFAADCAARALPAFARVCPEDRRPHDAVRVARRRAEGRSSPEEWSAAENAAESAARSAAWSAAESAARSAAWSAAESAARSAARSAAESAAWSAARSAAESAARSAAWSAAWRAEHQWQAERIETYLYHPSTPRAVPIPKPAKKDAA
jgi:hypothetical protein